MPTNFPRDPGGKRRFIAEMMRHVGTFSSGSVTTADQLRADLHLNDQAIVQLGETMRGELIAGGEAVGQIPFHQFLSARTVLDLIGVVWKRLNGGSRDWP